MIIKLGPGRGRPISTDVESKPQIDWSYEIQRVLLTGLVVGITALGFFPILCLAFPGPCSVILPPG